MKSVIFGLILAMAPMAFAERASYGSVDLTGLARDSWNYNPPGTYNAMICNVNGPDGFLSVRECTGRNCKTLRNLKRLAIVQVDTRYRQGNWVYVQTAFRTHSEDGDRLAHLKSLHVEGWAHDGYLCDYVDYE